MTITADQLRTALAAVTTHSTFEVADALRTILRNPNTVSDLLRELQPDAHKVVRAIHINVPPREDRMTGGIPVCGECGGWGEHLSTCSRAP